MSKFIFFCIALIGVFGALFPRAFAQNCDLSIENGIVTMSLECLKQGARPELSFEESVNLVWPYVDSIKKIYDTTTTSFESQGSSIEASSIADLDAYKVRENPFGLYRSLLDPSKTTMVHVPLVVFAYEQFKSYSFFAADRDISKYGDCAKQNFMVGMKALENILIKPGKTWNANQTFADLDGYCMGNDVDKYMFYQGICGVSSMAFRASLLDQNIEITKRTNHSKRYTTYYGAEVVGDDAALYENLKQFEVMNASEYPLLLKSKIIGSRPYLVFIHPKKLESNMLIYKQQTGPLTAQISRIWTKNGVKQSQTWKSSYMEKTNEAN